MACSVPIDLLQCAICLGQQTVPRTLPCLHSFCEGCIQQHVTTTLRSPNSHRYQFHNIQAVLQAENKDGFPCPTCREFTILPTKGVKGFPKDFRVLELIDVVNKSNDSSEFASTGVCNICSESTSTNLNYCVDCRKFFCQTCCSQHDKRPVLSSHIMITMATVAKQSAGQKRCKVHKKEHIKFFCEDCNHGICLICTLGSHGDHSVTNVTSTLSTKRSDLKGCMHHLSNQIWMLQDIMFNLTCMEGKIKGKYEEMKLQIRKNSRKLTNKIFGEELKLLNELEGAYYKQTEEVYRRKEQCRGHLEQFQKLQTRLDSVLQVQSVDKVTENYNEILREIQQVDITPEYKSKLLNLSNQVTYVPIAHQKVSLGCIKNSHTGQSQTDIPGATGGITQSNESVGEHQPQNVSNHLKYHGHKKWSSVGGQLNKTYSVSPGSLSIEQQSTVTRKSSAGDSPDSGYVEPSVYDPHRYMTPLSQHDLPSVKPLYNIEGTTGTSVHKPLNLPYGVTFDDQGNLIVAENGGRRLQFFNQHGHSTRVMPLGLCIPRCLTYTKDGHFAFTDENSKSIKIVSHEGRLLKDINNNMDSFPFGIAALPDGSFAVSDIIFETVKIISAKGELQMQCGSYGNCAEALDNPSYVATDHMGNILVSDSCHHEIKVFNKNGFFLYKFGGYGTEKGYLRYPKGIACDTNGLIYVADSGNDRVVAFSDLGIYVGIIASAGQGIKRPVGLAYSQMGKLAVTMPDHNEVSVFELTNPITSATRKLASASGS